jgi:hypothetical protein
MTGRAHERLWLPRGNVQTFKDRTMVPVERAIGIQEPDFVLDTERRERR